MITWRFTTASDGNLATHVGDDPLTVSRNRSTLAADLGVDHLYGMNQVHGDRVVVATLQTPDADGLVTALPGQALMVLVADCIPLLLWDQQANVIAAVHVGRRGLVNQVALNALDQMRELGAHAITGVMGPAICGHCYEVPLTLQEEVVAVSPASRSTTREGTPGLDIRNGLAAQLAERGVQVERDKRCTREDDQLFSYRRDSKTGRFAGVIMVA